MMLQNFTVIFWLSSCTNVLAALGTQITYSDGLNQDYVDVLRYFQGKKTLDFRYSFQTSLYWLGIPLHHVTTAS